MLRHSLYKKFNKKFDIGGTQSPTNPLKAPKLFAPANSYTTMEQPKGTITTDNFSFAPGVFKDEQAPNKYTPTASPFITNQLPDNVFDLDQTTEAVEQGPMTKAQQEERGIMAPAQTPGKKSNPFLEQAGDYATLGLTGISGGLNYLDDKRREQQFNQSIQQRDSKPLYDYNWMHGRTTSGGTEYQPIIMAKDGANIRKPLQSPEGANVEIEGGEFLILPDGTTEIAKGPSHARGGVDTILPEGTKVFSNHLKPMSYHKMAPEYKKALLGRYMQEGGSIDNLGLDYLEDMIYGESARKGTNESSKNKDANKTFAEIAKRYDLKPHQDILNNPFSSAVDKQTAQLMLDRNSQILDQLFRDQQILNNNSSGEPRAEMQEGGEFSLIKRGNRYINPKTNKAYKIPENANFVREGEPAKPGDFIVGKDGTIQEYKENSIRRIKNATKTSQAKDYAEGQKFISSWANKSDKNKELLNRANTIIEEGLANGTVLKDKDGRITITGDFKPNLQDRLALSQVINQSGKGFGTDKYQISTQKGTTGYSTKDAKGFLTPGKNEGSFVGGFNPQDYEQRFAYMKALAEGKSEEEALNVAQSDDPKQLAENRKFFLKEIGMNASDIPEDILTSNDFYDTRYADVTKSMEKTFSEGDYRPSIGNDLLSGWEHYDAINYEGKPVYQGPEEEDLVDTSGQDYNMTGTTQVDYKGMPYPISQAVPGAYALAQSQEVFPYAIPEVEAPYVRPQTLNIQSQLQDADNNAIAAMRYGADPNLAYIAGLDSKQQAYQTKQNYDAEGRSKVDLYNADAKFKADSMNAGLFNQVYNDMYAGAKSAQSEAKQAGVTNLINSRNQWVQDENLKKFYYNNFVNNYDFDSNDPDLKMNSKGTGSLSIPGVKNKTTKTNSSLPTEKVPVASTIPQTTSTNEENSFPNLLFLSDPNNTQTKYAPGMKFGGEMDNYLNPFKKKKGFRKK